MTQIARDAPFTGPDCFSASFQFPVSSIGPLARRHIESHSDGRVVAVFDGSFYIATRTGLVCVARAELGASPLNILVNARGSWKATGVRVGAKVHFSEQTFRVANRFSFPMHDASSWNPSPAAAYVSRSKVSNGLQELRRISRNRPEDGGLARFVDPEYFPAAEERVCFAAASSIAGLRCWLVSNLRNQTGKSDPDVSLLRFFVGLGPGLTPSGSDFLGGMMLALTALGATGMRDRLWSPLRSIGAGMDNPIASAHLAAAAEGMGAEAIHHVTDALIAGDLVSLRASIHGLDAIGHTSGWDALAGVACVLEAWSMTPPLEN